MKEPACSSLPCPRVPRPVPGRAAGHDAGFPGGSGVPARAAAPAGAAVPASGGPARGGARGAGRGASGALPAEGPGPGQLVREALPCRWDDEEITRLQGFLGTVDDLRGRRGRVYPLEYLLALPLAAGMAGDGELDAAAESAAGAPGGLLVRLGAPLDGDGNRAGRRQHPPPRTQRLRPGAVRRRAVRMEGCPGPGTAARHAPPPTDRRQGGPGAVPRGGRAPMLLSGIWDDGTTAAQLAVDTVKTNEIPVFRQLLSKIPEEDLRGVVLSPDQMHTQRRLARKISKAGARFIFTIGGNQPRLFAAADALPWGSVAGEAWTVDRGHGRIDVRTIKTLPPKDRILARWPDVKQVFLVERYSYGTDGGLLGAVAVLGVTSLTAGQAGPDDLLAFLRGHWSIEMIIMSVMSCSGRTPAGPAARTGPWPPSVTPSPASSACARSRTSLPSSAPVTATLTSSRCCSSG